MSMLPPGISQDPNLMVGLDTSDDAGVYRLTEDIALIQTVDFFTPVVDDPYTFGQIAAANALSDVYAMGGKPLTAMNLIAFPTDRLGLDVLAEILKGGADKVQEAGAIIVGGHSIQDAEPKYGLSLTGTVHPDRVLTNAGAQPGDRLVLTKPIGVGIITTAIKGGVASQEAIDEVTVVMAALNNTAAEVMQEVGVNACTDVTGFGLLGHASEMARGSGMDIRIYTKAVPVLAPAREYVRMGIVPGGTRSNLRYLKPYVEFTEDIDEETRLLLADAITSGGLLISVPADKADRLVAGLQARQTMAAAVVGCVVGGTGSVKAGAGEQAASGSNAGEADAECGKIYVVKGNIPCE